MPELPDITVYVERLDALLTGEPLQRIELGSPFVLRSVDPPLSELVNQRVTGTGSIGKRITISFDSDLHLVIHLMIAGRLRWRPSGAKIAKSALARFDFPAGSLLFTEAGTTRRASMHLVRGVGNVRQFDRGGLDVVATDEAAFAARLKSENHTLKRALTDPRLFSGIGNAYSDEILHRARLSPLLLTSRITDDESATLLRAVRSTLDEWTERLRREAGPTLPEHVTAFRDGMAVHGRFGQPCPTCGAPVQRIRYASNETNYCARCQTGGQRLADRGMSRLLREDWPRSMDEVDG